MSKHDKNKNKKTSTDDLIDSAIAQQKDWMENRRTFARKFLKTLNIFARPAPKKDDAVVATQVVENRRRSGLASYWFPILCAVIVVLIAVWVAFIRPTPTSTVVVVPDVPEPVVQTVEKTDTDTSVPMFDIVRIEPGGTIVVAGRWIPEQSVSIVINGEIVATERTDVNC